VNVDDVGLGCANISKLRARCDFANKAGLSVAEKEVGICIHSNPEYAWARQGRSGEITGTARS